MRTRSLAAVLAALPLALAAACSGGGNASSPPTVAGAAADNRPVKSGGTLTVALDADPDPLDPTTATTLNGRMVFASMCEKLYDIDANTKLVPLLASALPQLSADGKTATIKLRTGVKFNDGTTFDAAAVKRSLDRHRTLEESARAAELAAVDKVTVVDPSTVRLTLSRAFAPLTAQLADRAGMILSPAALDKLGDNFGTAPVCVGPYKFSSRTSGSQIVLDRAPDYYDAGKAKLDRIIYKIIIDPNVRAANLKSGDIQVATRPRPNTIAGLQSDPNLRVVAGGGLGFYGMHINIGNVKGATEEYGTVRTPLGGSPQLRQAWELSLDRNAINKTIFNGMFQPDCGPLPLDSPYRTPNLACSSRDVAKAKQLVAQSGVKTPIPVTMTVPNDSDNIRLGEVIQQMTKETGFNVSVRPMEFATTLEVGKAGKFDVMLDGWSGRVDPDGNLSNQVTTGGANNYAGMSDPVIDESIKQASTILDVAQRQALYAKAIQKAAELRGYIYIYHNKEYLGLNKNIAGVGFYADGLPRLTAAGYAQ
ncbi:MAG TPA: ABC transporter substrate-binding protein [Streptosporangiaceae bacterium]|nr:ABC transporter substrate-binding protein [Streptosporangiaceae bacterium]